MTGGIKIEEVHGFRFGGHVYPTRAEAEEAAATLASARTNMQDAIDWLRDKLVDLFEPNWPPGDCEARLGGICDDLFPIYGDRGEAGNAFMQALDCAADAYEALSLLRPPPPPRP